MIHIEVPCFFSIVGSGVHRQHVGYPLIKPSIRGAGSTAEAASWKLHKELREHIGVSGTLLIEELSAIPADAEETSYLLTFPVNHNPDATESDGVGRNARGRMEIRTPAIVFRMHRHTGVCLPRVHHQIFLLASDLIAADIPNALQTSVDAWFRSQRETLAENPLYAEEIAEGKGDRLLWLPMSFHPPHTAFEESQESSLKAMLGGFGRVNGATELTRVARCLNDRYPNGLKLDLEPDARVELLRYNLFTDPHPTPIAVVGPSGVGKTTLIQAAIRRHLDACSGPEIPHHQGPHHQAHIYHLDPNRVIAGMSIVGAWERRMVAILEHMVDPERKRPRDALYIDNPLALARVGKSAGSNLTLTTILRSWAEKSRLPMVVEATPESWRRLEELDRSFADLFQVIRVDPPERDRALRMVLSQVALIERQSAVSFEIQGIRRALELEQRFPGGRMLPGGLVDRLELLSYRYGGQSIGEKEVDQAFEQISGLRQDIFDLETPLKDEDLKKTLRSRLVGQDAAIEVLAEGIHVLRAGIARPGKPLACWLLVGPTGVGKTEAAKVLTETVFSAPDRLLRFDMNEYVDAGAVTRLIGDGHTEGLLTGAVRNQPLAVLLLDEIEKAHPLVHDLLLQLLDEGRLTDARGQRADFQKVFVILTSNVGAAEIARTSGFERAGKAEQATWVSAVTRHFRPELVNRLDRIVVFQSLPLVHIHKIALLQIQRILIREGFLRRTALLNIHPGAIDRLGKLGFDPVLGARALKRVLEAELVGGVATTIATLRVDQPVLVEIRPGQDQTLETQIATLRFAEPALAFPVPTPVTPERVSALLDALPNRTFRFEVGPQGVHVEGEDVLHIQRLLKDMMAEFEETIPGIEVEARHVAQIASKGRRLRYRRNRWNPGRLEWSAAVSFRSIREFISEGISYESSWGEEDYTQMSSNLQAAILEPQIEALRNHQLDQAWITLSPLVDSPALWKSFATYVDELIEACRLLLGAPEAYMQHPQKGWLPWDSRTVVAGCPVAIRVEGPALIPMISQEEGIHLAYPHDATPVAILLRVLHDPSRTPPLMPPITTDLPILRLYIPPGPHVHDKIEDLREGESVGEHQLRYHLVRWWWTHLTRTTTPVRPENTP